MLIIMTQEESARREKRIEEVTSLMEEARHLAMLDGREREMNKAKIKAEKGIDALKLLLYLKKYLVESNFNVQLAAEYMVDEEEGIKEKEKTEKKIISKIQTQIKDFLPKAVH